MRYLKPELLFKTFKICEVELEKLNISVLYKCFREGKYISEGYKSSYRLDGSNDIYLKIPKCIRYNYTESVIFNEKYFDYVYFYPYDTDENQIIYDYGVEFLKIHPNHKKTKNIMTKLRKTNPELFI